MIKIIVRYNDDRMKLQRIPDGEAIVIESDTNYITIEDLNITTDYEFLNIKRIDIRSERGTYTVEVVPKKEKESMLDFMRILEEIL